MYGDTSPWLHEFLHSTTHTHFFTFHHCCQLDLSTIVLSFWLLIIRKKFSAAMMINKLIYVLMLSYYRTDGVLPRPVPAARAWHLLPNTSVLLVGGQICVNLHLFYRWNVSDIKIDFFFYLINIFESRERVSIAPSKELPTNVSRVLALKIANLGSIIIIKVWCRLKDRMTVPCLIL